MANNVYEDKEGRYPVKPVTIETVDGAVIDYFDKFLNVHVENPTDDNRKVLVIFAGGERWAQIRKNKFRDENGTLILPIISVKRMDIDRTRGFGGMAQEVPEITISKVIHPKSSNVASLVEQRKQNFWPEVTPPPVIETVTIPFPDFCQIYYEVTIWAQHQEHMNEILEKIFYKYNLLDSFIMHVEYDGHKPKGDSYYFVGFREGNLIKQSNDDNFTDQERVIKYVYTFRTPAYLILDPKDEALSYGRNEKGEKVVFKQQSVNKIKLKEEVISLEDFEKLFG